jgi:TP901 family phage tail tape measure protein
MAVFTNELKLDVGPMLKSLTEAADKAEAAGKEIQDGLVKGIKAGSDEAKALSTAFQGVQQTATKSVTELKNSIAAMIASGRGSGDAFDALVVDLKAADAEAKKLKAALQEVDKLTVEVPIEVKPDAAGVQKATSGIKGQISEGFQGLGSSITGGIIGGGVASGVQAGAQAIIGAFKAVIDTGSEFEQKVAGLSAITGASGPQLDDLADRARNLAKEFGGSAATQVESFQTILSKFGPALADSPEALGQFSTNVNVLAKAAGLDAKGAVDALSNSMLQFGVDASDPAQLAAESGRFINVLAASAKVGAAEIPQVAEAILQAGVAAKGANLSFEETNAAIQVLAVGGKVGSEAGVALRNVLGLVQKASGPAAEQLSQMGLSAEGLGATLTTKGLGPTLEQLSGGFNKLGTDAEKNAALMKIFGTENAAAAGILLANVDTLKEFTLGVTGTQEAFEQAKINMATFGEFVSRVQANVEDFAISLFNGVSAIGKAFVEVLGPIFGEAADSIGDAFSAIYDYVKPVLMAIGGLIFTGIVLAFQNAAAVVKTVFGVIARVFESFGNALQPVKDAIAALFGGGGELDKGIDVVQVFKDVLSTIGEVLTIVSDVVVEFGGFLAEFIVIPFQILTGVVAAVINRFREWFGSQKENNKESEKGKGIIDRLRDAFNNIRGTISGATEAFRTIKETIGDFFNALASFDLKAAIEAFSGFGEKVAQAYDKGFTDVAARDKAKVEAKKAEAEFEALVDKIKGAGKAAENQTEGVVKNVKKAFTQTSNGLLAQQKITRDQYLELTKLIGEIQAGQKAPPPDDKNTAEAAIKRANDLFAIKEAILKTEQETATTAILARGLDKDAEKVALKKLELETQRKITEAYKETLGTQIDLNAETGEQRVVKVNFATDDKQLADINTKLQNFLQAEIRLEAELALKPEELEKNVQKSLKFFNESFKKNAKELTEGIIDPVRFVTAVEGLRGSFASLKKSLSDALSTPEVQASPALLAAYEEQILLVNQKLAEFNVDAVESLDKANIESAKRRLEVNRTTLKTLETDEKANAAEIRRIREENIALETQLKLAQIKSTGALRDQETKAILADANKQRTTLDETANKSGGLFKGLAKDFTKVITGLDFTEVFETTKEQATETADTIVDSLKSGTIAYQDAVAELDSIAAESGSVLDNLFKQLKKSFEKIAASSIDSLSSISAGFKGSEEDIKELLNATASAAAAGFAAILVSGEDFGKGFVILMLDILDATIPALVALILGQSFATNILLGAVVAAGLIATLKGAVAVAKAAANGFEEGGYTGNMGTKDIAGVVHGQEFVMHAKATKQFRPVLEQMNRGHMPMIDNGEFSAMRAELSAIRKRLDGMPNGIQGSQAMQLNVGFDNYIYERDRRRVAVRGLRG